MEKNYKIFRLINDKEDFIYYGYTSRRLPETLYRFRHEYKLYTQGGIAYKKYFYLIKLKNTRIETVKEFKCTLYEIKSIRDEYMSEINDVIEEPIKTSINCSRKLYIKYYMRRYREDNRDKIRKGNKRYYLNNREKILSKKKEANKKRYIKPYIVEKEDILKLDDNLDDVLDKELDSCLGFNI